MKTAEELNQLPDELTAEQEIELLSRPGDDSRDELLIHTVKAATRYAAALVRGMIPLDEVFSLASKALLLAIPKYKLKAGRTPTRLLVYAKPYIKREIAQAWRFREPVDYGRKGPPEDSGTVPFEVDEIRDEGGGPDFDQIDVNEKWAMVEPHLKKLSETERRILILLYHARLPGPEIGRMLGFTRENVRQVRLRAFRKIRNALFRERRLFGL